MSFGVIEKTYEGMEIIYIKFILVHIHTLTHILAHTNLSVCEHICCLLRFMYERMYGDIFYGRNV